MPHTTQSATYATSHHSRRSLQHTTDQSLLVRNMHKQQRTPLSALANAAAVASRETFRSNDADRSCVCCMVVSHVVRSACSYRASVTACAPIRHAGAVACLCSTQRLRLLHRRRSSSLTALPVLRSTYYKGPRRLRPPARVQLRHSRAWTSSLPRPSVGPRID